MSVNALFLERDTKQSTSQLFAEKLLNMNIILNFSAHK